MTSSLTAQTVEKSSAEKPSAHKPAIEKVAAEKTNGKVSNATTATKPVPSPTVATEMSAANTSRNETDGESQPLEPPVSAKILRYADRLVRRYDTNRDLQLQQNEWKAMRGDPRLADFDGDGIITLEELARRVARYGYRRKIRLIPKTLEVATPSPTLLQPITTAATDEKAAEPATAEKPAASQSTPNVTDQAPAKHDFRSGQRFYVAPRHRMQGLPGWFASRDANGDQQLTMAEFASKATQSDMKEFARYDANGDGVITAKECAGKSPSATPTPPPSSTDGDKNGS
ncbi:MAG: hypothetical protein U9N87_06090 [Planctomycetota bacterium]|nr:hypothetical protein [Planctomycetota bacterium]